MRPHIFIGSSTLGLKHTDFIKKQLETVGDCLVWTTAFKQNRSALDSLLKRVKLADYAILVATADDIVFTKGKKKVAARDNVIFEFGLFAGATGIDRTFLLVERNVSLPSDLEGIVVSRFSLEPKEHDFLGKRCEEIARNLEAEEKTSQLGLLPSTALALGYYHSFIKPVCTKISESKTIIFEGQTLAIKQFELNVIIPERLESSGVDDFKRMYFTEHGLKPAQTTSSTQTQRGYPFHFRVEEDEIDNKIQPMVIKLFDIPTTLNTLIQSTDLFYSTGKIGPNEDKEFLLTRELNNFTKALSFLISENSLTNKIVLVSNDIEI